MEMGVITKDAEITKIYAEVNTKMLNIYKNK